jgi:Ca-activated chloride channel family protein
VARRRALGQFATQNLLASIVPTQRSQRRWVISTLALSSLAMLVLALTDVRWGKTWREVPQKGIEVVFALDVSRSMLAEDVAPNRLGRAKQQIKDMVDAMQGDRVGLVVFAGDATRKIPLTSHYDDFKRTLDEVGPHDIRHGGSSLCDAIRVAADSFLTKTTDHKAIVLFTDGEDHESEPVKTAERAHRDRGIRVFTVGLGDDSQGARVPVRTARHQQSYLEHDGQQVWSKLDGRVLKEIATTTDGAYVPAGTKQVDMSRVYRDYVAQVEQQDFETARINGYVPRFQWFLGAALLLTLLEAWMGIGRRDRVTATSTVKVTPITRKPRHRAHQLAKAAAFAFLAFALGGAERAEAAAPDVYSLASQANQAMQAGNYEVAAEQYKQAAEIAPDNYELKYDQAVALYRKGDLDGARQLFTSATASSDRQLEAKARFNLANCDYTEALKSAQDDRAIATEKARSAISHYRGALAANPNDSDARSNIELAGMLIRQLREEQKQEQQQDNRQQQQQDQQSDSSQNDEQKSDQQKQQDQQGGQSQEDQKEQQNESSQSSDDSKSFDQQKKDTSASENPSQDNKSGESDQQDGETSQEKNAENKGSRSEASEPNRKQQPGDSSSDSRNSQQKQSDKSLSEANKPEQQNAEPSNVSESKGSQSDKPRDDAEAASAGQSVNDQPKQGGTAAHEGELENANQTGDQVMAAEGYDATKPMTRQEAMKMLQSVRDRDLMRRIQNQRKAQRQYVPGSKDYRGTDIWAVSTPNTNTVSKGTHPRSCTFCRLG